MHIIKERKSIFDQKLYNLGLVHLVDIISDEGKLLTYDKIKETFPNLSGTDYINNHLLLASIWMETYYSKYNNRPKNPGTKKALGFWTLWQTDGFKFESNISADKRTRHFSTFSSIKMEPNISWA